MIYNLFTLAQLVGVGIRGVSRLAKTMAYTKKHENRGGG